MAFIRRDNEEEDKKNTTLAESSSPSTGGGNGGSSAGMNPDMKDGFASLTQYLESNQDQADPLANKMAGTLGEEYSGLKSTIDTNADKAKGDVQAGSTIRNDSLIDKAFQAPKDFIQDPTKMDAFKGQRDASYKGPGSLQDSNYYQDANKAAIAGSQTFKLGQGPESTQNLLTKQQKNTTPGKTALNTAILNSDPNAKNKVNEAVNPFGQLQEYLAGKNSEVSGMADTARGEADALRSHVASKGNAARTNLEGSLDSRITQENQDAADLDSVFANNKINVNGADLSRFGLTPDLLKQLSEGATSLSSGLMLGSGNDTLPGDIRSNLRQAYNLEGDLSGTPMHSYLSNFRTNPGTIDRATVANPEDYATSQALQQLMGNEMGVLNPGLSELASTGNVDLKGMDLKNYIETKNNPLSRAREDAAYKQWLKGWMERNLVSTGMGMGGTQPGVSI